MCSCREQCSELRRLCSFLYAGRLFTIKGIFHSFDGYRHKLHLQVKLLTSEGNVKYETDCTPSNGNWFIPIYAHGSYIIRIEAQKGYIFSTFFLFNCISFFIYKFKAHRKCRLSLMAKAIGA